MENLQGPIPGRTETVVPKVEREFVHDMTQAFRDTAPRVFAEFIGQPVKMLEIGVYDGRSACYALDNILTHPASVYNGIDLIKGHEEAHMRARQNLKPFGDKVVLTVGDSKQIVPRLESCGLKYEMIYIDGCHTVEGCYADMKNCWRILKTSGVMLVDDYLHPDYNLKAAVEKFMGSFPLSFAPMFNCIHQDYQIAFRKINS